MGHARAPLPEPGGPPARAALRDRLLRPGHDLPARPGRLDRVQGARPHRRPARRVHLDHHDPVVHQAGLRPAVGLRAALRHAAAELFPDHVRDGRARRGRGEPDAGRVLPAARHHDHPALAGSGLHRRPDRRAHGGERQAGGADRRVPVRAVGRAERGLDPGRGGRRLPRGAPRLRGRVRAGRLLPGRLVPDGPPRGAGGARAPEPRGLRRDLERGPRGARAARPVGGGGLHVLLGVQPVVRARVLLLRDRRARLLPDLHRRALVAGRRRQHRGRVGLRAPVAAPTR